MTQFSNGLSYAALDIGYGETKLAYTNETGPILESFRSIARRSSRVIEQDNDSSIFFHSQQMIRRVLVGDQVYEVGDDADLSGDPNAVQALHADYIRTPEYMACYHAALLAIGTRRIGTLVTGLPVYQHAALKDDLERLLKGEHRVTKDLTVTVENVVVVQQPMGGALDSFQHAGLLMRMQDMSALVIDVGQGTTDWVVLVRGKPAVMRSHSHPVGVGAIVEGIRSRLIEQYHGAPSTTNIAIALKRGRLTVMVGAEDVDIRKEVAAAAEEVVGMCMGAMRNRVQTFDDINYVALVGGGGGLFREAIERAFAKTHVKILNFPEPEFANVRGYLVTARRVHGRTPAARTA